MNDQPAVTTFLFTDIEGSSRLWEEQPERMRQALARHDRILREAVQLHHGLVVKSTGDGVHAAFDDPRNAVAAAVECQIALAEPEASDALELRIRCGLHAGVIERRDDDFFGSAVNRAARIMSAAHGGQILVSQSVAELVAGRLPADISLRELGSVRLRDLSRAECVYQVTHAKLRQEFPALRSLEAVPNNLPQQLTTFVGREREQAEVKEALHQTRMLTLCGTGGLGKTRLSLQVGADVVSEYPDGVWFEEFAPITDERLVPHVVASALGVKEEAGRPVIDALVKHVRDRRLLLILDNCEHVVRGCAELVKQLLQSSPHLKILASSREQLQVAGERIYSMPALSVPPADHVVPLDEMVRYEAVRLFVDRATAVQPAFRLNAHNATAVVSICRRLDGIPLAIELAAARVRSLPVEKIAGRLDDRFRLLATGDRTALPRQQTLRALIDWSYDLLSEKERVLFRRLAVFAGGWTLEAAEQVAEGGELSEAEVIDVLGELVNKSLVIIETEGARYQFLETVRQYADERLRESGERDAVCNRHLAFYLAFAEAATAELAGTEEPVWVKRLDLDHENVLAAHANAIRMPGAVESAYRLVYAMKHYWFIRGQLNLAHRVSVEAIAAGGGEDAGAPRARALWVGGQICSHMGRYEEAQGYLHDGLAMARRVGERHTEGRILNVLAMTALGRGDRAMARTYSGASLQLARELGNRRSMAAASNALGQLHRLDGDFDAAEPLYEQTVALGRELATAEIVAVGLLNLAMVAIGRGRPEPAWQLLLEVFAVLDNTESAAIGQSVLEVASGLAASRGEWQRSARFLGVVDALTENTGMRRDPADEAFLRPLVENARGCLGDAAFAQALADGRRLSLLPAMHEARDWLSGKG